MLSMQDKQVVSGWQDHAVPDHEKCDAKLQNFHQFITISPHLRFITTS